MLKIRNIIFIACLFSIFSTYSDIIQAQSSTIDKKRNTLFISRDTTSINKYLGHSLDTNIITSSQRDKNGLLIPITHWVPLDSTLTFRDTIIYNPIFLPIVLTSNTLLSGLDLRNPKYSNSANKTTYHLISPDSTFAPLLKKAEEIQSIRKLYYTKPENMVNVKYSENQFAQITPMYKEPIKAQRGLFENIISPQAPTISAPENLKKQDPKLIHWLFRGEHSLQVAQNYISDNWYKGGNKNYNIKSYQKFMFNYKKDKVTLDNTVEWKLGMQNSSGDTIRNVSINDDLFRTYSILGYKAFNNWSYSSSLEIKSQLFDLYPENSNTRKSSLFSPLDINLGLGMSYSIDKKFKDKAAKKIKMSLSISPLSLNFRYIMDDKIDVTKYKLKAGKKTKTDFGSLINSDLTYNFNSFVVWNSRLKYFTDYKSIVSELENKVDLSFSRYFSTSLYLYLRYDETSAKGKQGYLQINEMVSFGLNYKW